MSEPTRDDLRRLRPPAATPGSSLSPLAITGLAFLFAGVVGGVIAGHIMLARLNRDGGDGRGGVVAIVVVSWIGIAVVAGLLVVSFRS